MWVKCLLCEFLKGLTHTKKIVLCQKRSKFSLIILSASTRTWNQTTGAKTHGHEKSNGSSTVAHWLRIKSNHSKFICNTKTLLKHNENTCKLYSRTVITCRSNCIAWKSSYNIWSTSKQNDHVTLKWTSEILQSPTHFHTSHSIKCCYFVSLLWTVIRMQMLLVKQNFIRVEQNIPVKSSYFQINYFFDAIKLYLIFSMQYTWRVL